ncbi:hypothetical protein DSL72_003246 [Monilinia vaccinii-corymbosi]|uniref:LYR motif-containing protein Cup1-like N-terminal domain-containing protein n=1 Tax=Monilinia vaccinii-corymbosi TaxID=61207 RepID=A0A8A3NZ80_9HELO|nr:hypothetical protein DSL72_003246 [Monilinia vaccinii-corymbosi]
MSYAPKSVYRVSRDLLEYLQTFRQKYRALLREATYLPDPDARKFAHDLIVNRCNPHNPKKRNPIYWGTDYFRSHFDLETCRKRSKKMAQKLHLLERINLEGSSKDLQDVLLRTYGRAGHRRRELLSQLLRPGEQELPQDDTALSHVIDSQIAKNLDATKHAVVEETGTLEVAKRQRRELKELTMFLASQQAHNPMESIRGKIKKLLPDIPEKNAWGRRLPAARKEKMRRKWWAYLLERVLPPLPEHEWDRLRDLATEKQPIEELRPRRKEAISLSPSQPINHGKRMSSLLTPARLNLNYWEQENGKNPIDPDDPLKKHTRRRAMRRIYGMIWSISSKMVQDENTKEIKITWGGERSPAAAGEITKPSLKDAELFEMPEGSVEQARGTMDKRIMDRKTRRFVERQAKL